MRPCCRQGENCALRDDPAHLAEYQHIPEGYTALEEDQAEAMATLAHLGFQCEASCAGALLLSGGDWRKAVKALLAQERARHHHWQCRACTFINAPVHLACEACATQRMPP